MNNIIVISALIVAVISLIAAGMAFRRYRRMKREKNSRITRCIRECDRITRELEHTRIERNAFEKLIKEEINRSPKIQ